MAAPKIIVASEAGACYGVERALKLVREAAGGELPVRTLGPLIHNPRVVAELGAQGVESVSSPEEAEGCTLVLRTHGATPDEEARAKACCASVVDAVCPFVKRVHRAVERMAAEGRTVVIAGEAGHPEVEATRAHAEGSFVAASADEARSLGLIGPVGLVAQTTLAKAVFDAIADALRESSDDVLVENTICDATSKHQEAAAALAAQVDAMVVLGGRNSANTRHLAEICSALCPATFHVESEDELEAESFSGASRIGITAGASTPAEQIEALRDRLAELCS